MISVWWRWSQVSEVHTTVCEWNWLAVVCCACTKSHVIMTEVLSLLALRPRLLTLMNDAFALCCSISGWWITINVPDHASVVFQNHFLSSFLLLYHYCCSGSNPIDLVIMYIFFPSFPQRWNIIFQAISEKMNSFLSIDRHKALLQLTDVSVRWSREDLAMWALTMLRLILEIYRRWDSLSKANGWSRDLRYDRLLDARSVEKKKNIYTNRKRSWSALKL